VNNCQDKKQKNYFGTFEWVSSIFGQAKGEEHRAKPALAFPFLTYFSGNGDAVFSKKIPAAECSVAEAVSFSYRQSVAQSLSWLRNDRWSGDASHSENTAKENRRLPWIFALSAFGVRTRPRVAFTASRQFTTARLRNHRAR
jgi:hypothetical protein